MDHETHAHDDHGKAAHVEHDHAHVNGVSDHPDENSTMTMIREGAEDLKDRAEQAMEDLGHAAETVVKDVKEFFTGEHSEDSAQPLTDIAAHGENRRASHASQGAGSRRASEAATGHNHAGSRKGSQAEAAHGQAGSRRASHAEVGHGETGSRRGSKLEGDGEFRVEEHSFVIPDKEFSTAPGIHHDVISEERRLSSGMPYGHEHADHTDTYMRSFEGDANARLEELRQTSDAGHGGHAVDGDHAHTDTVVRNDPLFDVKTDGDIAWQGDHRDPIPHEHHAVNSQDTFAVQDDGIIEWAEPPHYAPPPPPEDMPPPVFAEMPPALIEPPLPSMEPPAMLLRMQDHTVMQPYGAGTDTFVREGEARDTTDEYRRHSEHHDKHHGAFGLFGHPMYRVSNVHPEVDEKHCAVCMESVDHETHLELRGTHFHRHCFESAHSGECSGCNKKILLMEPSVSVASLGRDWHANCLNCGACGKHIDGPFNLRDDVPTCTDCFLQKFAPHCVACTLPIEGTRLKAMGDFWHPECFVCEVCHDSLSKDGQHEYFRVEGKPYCRKDVEAAHLKVV